MVERLSRGASESGPWQAGRQAGRKFPVAEKKFFNFFPGLHPSFIQPLADDTNVGEDANYGLRQVVAAVPADHEAG